MKIETIIHVIRLILAPVVMISGCSPIFNSRSHDKGATGETWEACRQSIATPIVTPLFLILFIH